MQRMPRVGDSELSFEWGGYLHQFPVPRIPRHAPLSSISQAWDCCDGYLRFSNSLRSDRTTLNMYKRQVVVSNHLANSLSPEFCVCVCVCEPLILESRK